MPIDSFKAKQLQAQVNDLPRRVPWIREHITGLKKLLADAGPGSDITGLGIASRAAEAITTTMELVHRLREIEKQANYIANGERRAAEQQGKAL